MSAARPPPSTWACCSWSRSSSPPSPERTSGMTSPRSSRTSARTSPAASRLVLVRVLVVVMAVLLAVPAAARAQTSDTGNRAVIILDASKSMNDPAGNGATRLDAAKTAFDQLLQKLPQGAPVGLRVYG